MRRLEPDPKLQTSWSVMPELWIEFVRVAASKNSLTLPVTNKSESHGVEMLSYLRRTEKLFSLGLCRGQLSARLLDVKHSIKMNLRRISKVTPSKIIHRLRRV